ncbi:apolipoprotein D-like [Conger conger]|uniref:apolipoprotein D-like n=1 Tax=Conger conger TaxID=82655 RepID=UPI002A5A99BF|nr:apolipoprotein D-like [Conger conger]
MAFSTLPLILLLPLVSGQVFHWGPCPEASVQSGFDIHKYLGRWFEIEKLPAFFEKGKCIEANYSLRPDGTIKVFNSELRNGKVNSIEGTAVVQDIRQPAKLGVSFFFFTPYSPYWVLYTDYENLAMVYSCIDVLRLFHVDYAWILGRARALPVATTNRAKMVFSNNNIDVSKMISTDQKGCGNSTTQWEQ